MKLFPRWHSPESVAKQLIEGLESGALTLGSSTSEVIAEALRLAAEVNTGLARLDPGYSPPELPTAETLTELERWRPGAVHHALAEWQRIHAELKSLEAERSRITRRVTAVWWFGFLFGIAAAATLACIYLMLPTPVFAGSLISFVVGIAFGALPRLRAVSRTVMEANAKMLCALTELAPQARAAANVRTV